MPRPRKEKTQVIPLPDPVAITGAAEVRDTAKNMALDAVGVLYDVACNSTNAAARVAAARELLERAYGKAHVVPGGEAPQAGRISVVFGADKAKPAE